MTTVVHEPSVKPLIDKVAAYLPADKVGLVDEAFAFAAEAHRGQLRLTGDPYIVHPLDAAITVAGLQLNAAAVAAALLHDVQEDCGVPNDEIKRRFGAEVARLVDGATKLERIPWRAPDDRPGDRTIQAENLRKMFLAMAEDPRVVIIKLADRLHNMRTLDAKPPDKQLRTAQETMEIYAPLANRLGIWQLKWELEDLAFRHLQPERYKQIARLIQSKRTVRERYVAQVEKIVREELEKHGIQADVKGRAKHIYSIAQKADKYAAEHKTFEQIYDLLALRVIVETVGDCYNALGVVHGLWHPIPGQFDDYIGSPKESLYQSLHTTVMAIGARPLEIQIRTQEMHQLAEYGVAAHWRYKEGAHPKDLRYQERMSWLRQLIEWQREMPVAEEFVESVKTDLFRDQVFVYTPKGEIKELPAGATPIDFAYRVHTDLGHHCVGGKVNGRLVPLNHPLQNGDVVEILSGKSSRGPSRDWLNTNLGYAKAGHTREKIRQWFKKQERADNIERGRELIDKELRRLNLSLSEHGDEILRIFKYEALDDFLAALGYGGVTTVNMAMRLAPLIHKDELPPAPPEGGPSAPRTQSHSVQVLGTGDLLTQIARCCNAVPGDPIIGYITRSRGVTIHRRDCFNVLHEDEKDRLVDVEWGRTGELYPVAVHIDAWDRVGLLRDLSTVVSEEKVNMVGVRTEHEQDRITSVYLTLETTGISQLSRLMSKLESVRGVITVNRQVDGQRRSSGSL
jgi:guanosine-3',5'-bis(diphosphate) 3'-pyrophosphohydrolase